MNKFCAALGLFALSLGVVAADEFNGTVKNVGGNKITIVKPAAKGSPKGTKGEEVVLTAAANVKVNQGTYNRKTKTYTTGDAVTGGLQDPVLTTKNTRVHVTTDSNNNVTEILVLAKKKKKAS